jgi:hypothetical protein
MYIRVQRFLQLGSPRPLMVAKFTSKTHLYKKKFFRFFIVFRPHLPLKFVKGASLSTTTKLNAILV